MLRVATQVELIWYATRAKLIWFEKFPIANSIY